MLVGGFVCGLALSIPWGPGKLTRRWALKGMVALGATVALLASAASLPRAFNFQKFISNLGSLETRTLKKYNAAMTRFRTHEIQPDQLTKLVETEVMTEWDAQHNTLARLHGLPYRQKQMAAMLVRYMELRRNAWGARAAGMGELNTARFKEAIEQQRQASEQLKELGAFLRR